MQINIPTERLANASSQVKNKITTGIHRLQGFPKWSIYAIAGVVILLLGLIVFLCWPKPVAPTYPTVEAQPVVLEDVEVYGEYTGKIRAKQYVEVRARVEGYLERMHFAEGGYVNKNDILFTIDPKLYKASVEKAKAQLNKNQALALKAERNLARIQPLYEQNAASKLDLDNAIAAYESAKAEVTMSEADLVQAEIALSYTTVRSPISGFISESSADIGTLVGPGGKSRSKERNVKLGQKIEERNWNPYITITLADNTEYPFIGIVDFADPQVDPNTGTFSVRAQMPNPDHILLPGQLTRVRLLLDVREDAVVVPTKALVIEKGGAYVFVARQDSVVEKRFIELGPEIPNKVVVERGLGADEMIIVEGFHKLSHGMKVSIVNGVEDEE